MKQPALIIGTQASGKTTLAERLTHHYELAEVVKADTIAAVLACASMHTKAIVLEEQDIGNLRPLMRAWMLAQVLSDTQIIVVCQIPEPDYQLPEAIQNKYKIFRTDF